MFIGLRGPGQMAWLTLETEVPGTREGPCGLFNFSLHIRGESLSVGIQEERKSKVLVAT